MRGSSGHGISTARRLRVQGSRAESGHGHVRRRQRALQGLGAERRGRGDAAGRHLPRGRSQHVRLGRRLLRRPGRGDPRQGDPGPPRPGDPLHQGDLSQRSRPQRRGIVAVPPHQDGRGQPAAGSAPTSSTSTSSTPSTQKPRSKRRWRRSTTWYGPARSATSAARTSRAGT